MPLPSLCRFTECSPPGFGFVVDARVIAINLHVMVVHNDDESYGDYSYGDNDSDEAD